MMQDRPTMEATLAAYQTARARSAAAAQVEAELLHTLVDDTQEAGMSVRESAAMLHVPKSTVARHRLNVGTGLHHGSTWLTPDTYVEAHNAAWSADPNRRIEYAPFLMEEQPDGTRQFTAIPSPGGAIWRIRRDTD